MVYNIKEENSSFNLCVLCYTNTGIKVGQNILLLIPQQQLQIIFPILCRDDMIL